VRSWGAPGAQHLAALADDASGVVFVRVRAVYALRLMAGSPTAAATRARLRALARHEGGELLVRRAAFDALCEGFDAVDDVAGFLQHHEAGVREGAGWALSRCRDAAGRAAVRARLGQEGDAGVRQSLHDALATPVQGGAGPGVPGPTTPGRGAVSRGG